MTCRVQSQCGDVDTGRGSAGQKAHHFALQLLPPAQLLNSHFGVLLRAIALVNSRSARHLFLKTQSLSGEYSIKHKTVPHPLFLLLGHDRPSLAWGIRVGPPSWLPLHPRPRPAACQVSVLSRRLSCPVWDAHPLPHSWLGLGYLATLEGLPPSYLSETCFISRSIDVTDK